MGESKKTHKHKFLSLLKKAYNKYIKYREKRECIIKYFYAYFGYKIINLRKPVIGMREDNPNIIFVDVSSILQGDSGTGIHRVTKEVSKYLVNNKDKYSFEFIAASIESKGYAKVQLGFDGNKIKLKVVNGDVRFKAGDKLLSLDYAPAIMLSQLSIYRELKRKGIKIFFVVYDLLPSMHPEWFFLGEGAIQKAWLKEMSQVGKMICISQSVKNDLLEWSQSHNFQLKENCGWFHLGYEPKTFACDNQEKKLVVTDAPVFLMVSTVEPRKGHSQILDAFDKLWLEGEDICLVFVGLAGWKIPDVWRRINKHQELGKRLFWFQGVSDEALGSLYRRADAVILPSNGEGFGLSLVEGAYNGKPLILRDLPVFREIAGDNALYFHGNEGNDITRCIKEWLLLWVKGQQPLPENMHVQNWSESVLQLLKQMEIKDLR